MSNCKQKVITEQKILDKHMSLKREELVLIMFSEETKDTDTYGNLYQAIGEFDELTNDDINFSGKFDKRAKFILSDIQAKKKMIEHVKSEWRATKKEDIAYTGDQVNCELCGRDNLRIYYIHNKVNDNELHVGSTCITKFPGLAGIKEARKNFASLEKERRELKCMEVFNSEFPGTSAFLKNIRAKYNDFPILLPSQVDNPLSDVISNLEETYAGFIKEGRIEKASSIFMSYRNLQNKYAELEQLAQKTIIQNKNLFNVCKRREITWMKNNKKYDLIKRIADNGGLYDIKTISEVYNYEFVIELQPLFETGCNGTMFQFEGIRFEDKSIYFASANKSLNIKASLQDFMSNVGCKCVFKNHYIIEFSTSVFAIPITNIQTVVTLINQAIGKNEDGIKYVFDDEKERVYLEREKDDAYIKIGEKFLLKRYFELIDKTDQQLGKKFIADYNSFYLNEKWESRKERQSAAELNQMMKKR